MACTQLPSVNTTSWTRAAVCNPVACLAASTAAGSTDSGSRTNRCQRQCARGTVSGGRSSSTHQRPSSAATLSPSSCAATAYTAWMAARCSGRQARPRQLPPGRGPGRTRPAQGCQPPNTTGSCALLLLELDHQLGHQLLRGGALRIGEVELAQATADRVPVLADPGQQGVGGERELVVGPRWVATANRPPPRTSPAVPATSWSTSAATLTVAWSVRSNGNNPINGPRGRGRLPPAPGQVAPHSRWSPVQSPRRSRRRW
jgi:hypothetical protein